MARSPIRRWCVVLAGGRDGVGWVGSGSWGTKRKAAGCSRRPLVTLCPLFLSGRRSSEVSGAVVTHGHRLGLGDHREPADDRGRSKGSGDARGIGIGQMCRRHALDAAHRVDRFVGDSVECRARKTPGTPAHGTTRIRRRQSNNERMFSRVPCCASWPTSRISSIFPRWAHLLRPSKRSPRRRGPAGTPSTRRRGPLPAGRLERRRDRCRPRGSDGVGGAADPDRRRAGSRSSVRCSRRRRGAPGIGARWASRRIEVVGERGRTAAVRGAVGPPRPRPGHAQEAS